MSRGFMGLVRDFNQLSYAVRTLDRIQKAKETRYGVQVTHGGLGRTRVVRGPTSEAAMEAGRQLYADWDQIWQKRKEAEQRREQRDRERQSAAEKAAFIIKQKELAEQRSDHCKQVIASTGLILAAHSQFKGPLDWAAIRPRPEFSIPQPEFPALPRIEQDLVLYEEPRRNTAQYQISSLVQSQRIPSPTAKPVARMAGFLGRLFGEQRRLDAENATDLANWEAAQKKYDGEVVHLIDQVFAADHQVWQQAADKATAAYNEANKVRESEITRRDRLLKRWAMWRDQWSTHLKELDERICRCRTEYSAGDPAAVASYFSTILITSDLPDWVPQEWRVAFDSQTRQLAVSYRLPNLDDVPSLAGYTYIQKSDSFIEVPMKKGDHDRLYDQVSYQIALRCFHDIFASDSENVLAGICFNGYVRAISAATGNEQDTVLLFASSSKEAFQAINLAHVDPAACFLSLQEATQAKPHLFKPVPERAILLQADSPSCPIQRSEKGELYSICIYAGESTFARILACSRPPRWMFELTAELIRTHVQQFLATKRAHQTIPDHLPDNAQEYNEFVDESIDQIKSAAESITVAVNNELMAVWEVDDGPDDAIGIMMAINHLLAQLEVLYRIESKFSNTPASPDLYGLKLSLEGLGDTATRLLTQIADQIDSTAMQEVLPDDGRVELTAIFDMSPIFKRISSEIERYKQASNAE